MWFDDKESRRHNNGYGKAWDSIGNATRLTSIESFRNTPISSEFHSSRLQPRTRRTSSRPLWQWRRRSRTASDHRRVPPTRRAKWRLTRDVQLKAIRVDAAKSNRLAHTTILHYYNYNAPSRSPHYLFVPPSVICFVSARACFGNSKKNTLH